MRKLTKNNRYFYALIDWLKCWLLSTKLIREVIRKYALSKNIFTINNLHITQSILYISLKVTHFYFKSSFVKNLNYKI